MAEKSLLQTIREKELETNISLDVTRREAADLIEAARREAEGILRGAEKEAAGSAEEYTRQEGERISREVEEIKRKEMDRAREAEAAGEKHVEEAVKLIVRAVVPD
jgi:vacuolar-type H+-ATPase subunit H